MRHDGTVLKQRSLYVSGGIFGLAACVALALPGNGAVAVQAEYLQRVELLLGGTRDFARWVQVFHPYPPFAARMPGQQPTAQRSHQ